MVVLSDRQGNATAQDPGIVYASLDLQPSWKRYVDTFGYEFEQWDMHKSGAAPILGTSFFAQRFFGLYVALSHG